MRWDWVIHFSLCFIAIWQRQASILATVFVAGMIEYEQKKQVGTYNLTWKDYLLKHSLGDFIADALGIGLGFLIRSLT